MVVYGLLEGDFDDDYLSPTSPLAGRKKPDGTGNANDAAVGTASPGAPAAARSPRRESDVARIIRLAAVDAMMTGDRRKSSEDHRAFLAVKTNELETFNMLSRNESPKHVPRSPGEVSPGRSPRLQERAQKALELQQRNKQMLAAVDKAVTVEQALAAEQNRQEAEAQIKAATEARQKAAAAVAAAEAQRAAEESRILAEAEAQKAGTERQRSEPEAKQKAEAEADAEAQRKSLEQAAAAAAQAEPIPTPSLAENAASASGSAAAVPVTPTPSNGSSNERSTPEALAQADKYLERLKTIKQNVRPAIKADRNMSNACFKAKMAVTLKVGQITNSRQQVRRVSNELSELLVNAGRLSATAREWVMDVLAKQLANQAEKEVAVFRPLAFPMARVVQNLVASNPDFCDIFLGRLMKRNVYLVPKYPIREKSETPEAFYKRLGMKKRDDEWEKDMHYEERMCGTAALYAAFIQTLPEGVQGTGRTLADGWTWLARLLNMPPRKITPQLLMTFLETAGPEFLRHYRKQALKLLRYISEKYLPHMPKESVAATTRLRLHLDSIRNKTHLPEAEGFRFSEN